MDQPTIACLSALAVLSLGLGGVALNRIRVLSGRVKALETRPVAPVADPAAAVTSGALDPAAVLLRLTGEVRDVEETCEDLTERVDVLEGQASKAFSALTSIAGARYGRQTILPAPVPPSSGRKPRG